MFVGYNINRVVPNDQSLTMATAVSNGIDRLERLLTKKKFGSIRRERRKQSQGNFAEADFAALDANGAAVDEYSVFPQPSFIRPTTMRMIARDEVCVSSTRSRAVQDPPLQLVRATSTGPAEKKLSLPGPQSSGIERSTSSRKSSRSPHPQVPRRSSSLVVHDRSERPSLASLVHYEFTERESRNAERSLSTLYAPSPRCARADHAPTKGLLPALPLHSPTDTPPVSDHEGDSSSAPPTGELKAETRSLIPVPQPTPEPSPDLTPVSHRPDHYAQAATRSELHPRLSREGLRPRRLLGQGSEEGGIRPRLLNQRSSDGGTGSLSLGPPMLFDPVLQEPAVGDFLCLSDDDIAESRPPSPSVPTSMEEVFGAPVWPETADADAPPRTPSSPHCKAIRGLDNSPRSHPPATLPPSPDSIWRISARMSMASNDDRAAATAAFEVARIASRYRFDLIYIISLWPKRMVWRERLPLFTTDVFESLPSSASSSSTCSSTRLSRHSSRGPDGFDTTALSSIEEQSTLQDTERSGLNYRFLAAYGLHMVKPPLHISYNVHSKILKSAGWVEYREPDAKENQFARGYARSFYTGYAPVVGHVSRQSSAAGSCDSDAGVNGALAQLAANENFGGEGCEYAKNNRGIVFAAYRKPPVDETNLAMSREELGEMQHDAEALVDMILDYHMIKRRGVSQ